MNTGSWKMTSFIATVTTVVPCMPDRLDAAGHVDVAQNDPAENRPMRVLSRGIIVRRIAASRALLNRFPCLVLLSDKVKTETLFRGSRFQFLVFSFHFVRIQFFFASTRQLFAAAGPNARQKNVRSLQNHQFCFRGL